MLNVVLLVTLLQSPMPLPRIVSVPEGFTGGADIAVIARGMAGVLAGELPAEQTGPVTIEPGVVYRLEWQRKYDLWRPVKVRLWLDGAIIKNFTAADLTVTGPAIQGDLQSFSTNAGVIPPFTGEQLGNHTLALTWYDAGPSGSSVLETKPEDAALAVTVAFTSPPPTGTGMKVITIKVGEQADGSFKLLSMVTEIVK